MNREDLEAHWMPFTANRHFKAKPRILARAKGMHFWTDDGRQILDGVAGLWCVNAGHSRPEITSAVAKSLEQLDFAPPLNMGHPQAFEWANAVKKIAPAGMDHVFFVNSGSEAVDTALKIALQYQRLKGEATRTRLIGRERGYHGVNLGAHRWVAWSQPQGLAPVMVPGGSPAPHPPAGQERFLERPARAWREPQ
jgi:beta-alanine--pyruvate transaminase